MAKVATLITDMFEDVEFTGPRDALVEAGHEVVTIEKKAGNTVEGKQGESKVTIDKAIEKMTVSSSSRKRSWTRKSRCSPFVTDHSC